MTIAPTRRDLQHLGIDVDNLTDEQLRRLLAVYERFLTDASTTEPVREWDRALRDSLKAALGPDADQR